MAAWRPPPTREEEIALHRRLMEDDPVAPSELASAYLAHLIAHLTKTNSYTVSRDFIEQAAGDAIISLIKDPIVFDSNRSGAALPLFAFLKMAARGDLKNILKKEGRHWRGRISMKSVEQSLVDGNHLSSNEVTGSSLENREEAEKVGKEVLLKLRKGLNPGEEKCLELMLEGARATKEFATALSIENLTDSQQRREVKRVKDKLKKRMERGNHGRAS
jgi:hypothetical protein